AARKFLGLLRKRDRRRLVGYDAEHPRRRRTTRDAHADRFLEVQLGFGNVTPQCRRKVRIMASRGVTFRTLSAFRLYFDQLRRAAFRRDFDREAVRSGAATA